LIKKYATEAITNAYRQSNKNDRQKTKTQINTRNNNVTHMSFPISRPSSVH